MQPNPNVSTPPPSVEEMNNCVPPEEVRVGGKGASLTVSWPDGRSGTFTAPFLRDNSQSAGSKKLRLAGLAVPARQDLTITAVRPIGAYAINIVFSDGYDRGIYPWAFLLQLAESTQVAPTRTALKPEDFLKCN